MKEHTPKAFPHLLLHKLHFPSVGHRQREEHFLTKFSPTDSLLCNSCSIHNIPYAVIFVKMRG